jgi:hypothetical protein
VEVDMNGSNPVQQPSQILDRTGATALSHADDTTVDRRPWWLKPHYMAFELVDGEVRAVAPADAGRVTPQAHASLRRS